MDLTNTHEPETTSYKVFKVWDDSDNKSGKRPKSIKVQLLSDGKEYGEPVVLNEGNKWAYEWIGLAKRAAGKDIKYSVKEIEVPDGYTVSVEERDGETIITNTGIPEPETEHSVLKIWDDLDNKSGDRPKSIKVQLMSDGKKYGEPVILNDDNGWKYEWTKLPKESDGKDIVYTVVEVEVPEGYSMSAEEKDGQTVITNSRIPDTGDMSGLWKYMGTLMTAGIALYLLLRKRGLFPG